MKRILFILFPLLLLTSCEEVISVDLDTQAPRLVIDGYMRWVKGTAGNEQSIRLSTTAGFYESTVPAVSGASVIVTDTDGNVFTFLEDGTTGIYRCFNFIPQLEMQYTLTVTVNGQVYTAVETMKPAPEITDITQESDGGFTGDEIEVRAFFTDNAATDDFYLYRFKTDYNAIPLFEAIEDRFINGNLFFALFSDADLSAGDQLQIDICGISERYYNYMNILTGVAGSNSGSPFSTPPATVRGNLLNTTDESNFALGYFAASEVETATYTVQ